MTLELGLTVCLLVWTMLIACVATAWAVRHHYNEYVDHLERIVRCYSLTGMAPSVKAPPRPSGCPAPGPISPPIDLSPEACMARKEARDRETDPTTVMIRQARERAASGREQPV